MLNIYIFLLVDKTIYKIDINMLNILNIINHIPQEIQIIWN